MDLFLCQYTLEDQHGTKKSPNWKGKSSSKPSFWGSMLIFQGVTPPPKKKNTPSFPIVAHRCLPMSSARIIALHRAAHLSWYRKVGWRNREILGTQKNGWVVFCLGPGVIFVCFFFEKQTNIKGFQHTYDSHVSVVLSFWSYDFWAYWLKLQIASKFGAGCWGL